MSAPCLYTRVQNTSGSRRTFGFLPPHGRTLDDEETLDIFGDLRYAVGGNQGAESSVKRRSQEALENALLNCELTILKSPSTVYQDVDTGYPQELQVNDGNVQSIWPCWSDC